MTLPTLSLEHTVLLHALLWATLAMAALLLLLILLSAGVQTRADRINNRRILLFQEWEEGLPNYLYQGQTREEAFGRIEAKDLGFFQTFLGRYRNTLGGEDAKRLRTLYRDLGLEKDLPRRLTHRNPVVRAQAAMEIQSYGYAEHLGLVEKLLDDPKPFVAFAAARTLGALHGIDYAPHVFDWVQRQEDYQQDRLLELLEGFGPDLLRWLEMNLEPTGSNPTPWRLYALLAAGMRDEESLPTLRGLLKVPEVELQAAVLRAMGALGDLSVWEEVRPFFHASAPALRLHAARAAGLLGHIPAVDELVRLLADPVYEVRREAGTSLMALGNVGWEALEWIADDPSADRFARDMALDGLDWGRP